MDILEKPSKRRVGDGGVYLVVADETQEFMLALKYTTHLASARRGHVLILHVLEPGDFQHWSQVEARINHDMRLRAEAFLSGITHIVHDLTGLVSGIIIEQGEKAQCVVDVINRDPTIMALVLGSQSSGATSGPLISYFTGKGRNQLAVPLVVVPAGIDMSRIDDLA